MGGGGGVQLETNESIRRCVCVCGGGGVQLETNESIRRCVWGGGGGGVQLEKRSVRYTCEKVHLIYNFSLPWLELLKFC